MRFADNLLELYLKHFDCNESDSLDLFIQSILEQMDHNDLIEICKGFHKEELSEVLGSFFCNSIEGKIKNINITEENQFFHEKLQQKC